MIKLWEEIVSVRNLLIPKYGSNMVTIAGSEMLAGRYLIVQLDNGEDPLNLKEVTAYGTPI